MMIKILFVCHGNICRSPMAEFVFRSMIEKEGWTEQIFVASAATSTEEIGNPIHHETRAILTAHGISSKGKQAVQLTKKDYAKYDFLIGMDSRNMDNMRRMLGGDKGHKMSRLLDFTDNPRDIADPWYTGDFDRTYEEVCAGCLGLLEIIRQRLD